MQVPPPPGKEVGMQQTLMQLFSVLGQTPMILPTTNLNSNGQSPVKPTDPMEIDTKEKKQTWLAAAPAIMPPELVKKTSPGMALPKTKWLQNATPPKPAPVKALFQQKHPKFQVDMPLATLTWCQGVWAHHPMPAQRWMQWKGALSQSQWQREWRQQCPVEFRAQCQTVQWWKQKPAKNRKMVMDSS